MKTIILSILVLFLSLGAQAAKVVEKPDVNCEFKANDKKNVVMLDCANNFPVNTLAKIFKDKYPNFSFNKTMPSQESNEGYSVFGTGAQATYVQWTKEQKRGLAKVFGSDELKLFKMHQGIKGKSKCFYDYEIKMNSTNSRRICDVADSKKTERACGTIIANDPLLQKEGRCEEFIQSVLACSKNDNSMEKCKNTFMAVMGKNDDDKPHADPNNKPLPSSSPGIADSGDDSYNDFSGEPDDPAKYKNSAKPIGAK